MQTRREIFQTPERRFQIRPRLFCGVLILLLLTLFPGVPAAVAAATADMTDVTDTAATAEIVLSGSLDYKGVRLTPEVYRRAGADLADILILDEAGEAVPYFIHHYGTVVSGEMTRNYPLTPADSFVKEGASYDDYYTETEAGRDILATSVTLHSDSGLFAKNVELWGGYDGLIWDFIQEDKLYRVEGNEKLYLTFAKPLKYTYYRFVILNNAEERFSNDTLVIGGAVLEYSRDTVDRVFFTETLTPEFTAEESGKDTLIRIYGIKNLNIHSLTLGTEDPFKRRVSVTGGGSEILYNLSFGGNTYRDLTLELDGFRTGNVFLELRIANGDDRPVQVKDITVSYFAGDVVFKGESGGHYTLSFGNPPADGPPVYDIVNYKDLILEEGYDVAAVGKITPAPAPAAKPEQPDYTAVFNAVIIAVSVLLGFVILLRLRRSRSS